jgi:hypothetical protein
LERLLIPKPLDLQLVLRHCAATSLKVTAIVHALATQAVRIGPQGSGSVLTA